MTWTTWPHSHVREPIPGNLILYRSGDSIPWTTDPLSLSPFSANANGMSYKIGFGFGELESSLSLRGISLKKFEIEFLTPKGE